MNGWISVPIFSFFTNCKISLFSFVFLFRKKNKKLLLVEGDYVCLKRFFWSCQPVIHSFYFFFLFFSFKIETCGRLVKELINVTDLVDPVIIFCFLMVGIPVPLERKQN